MKVPHISVLQSEIVELFSSIEKGVIVDCTLGFGGHSNLLLEANKNIEIFGCDKDSEALEFSKKRLKPYANRTHYFHGAFSQALNHIEHTKIKGVLADIGVSSLQLDKKERGFGFESDVLDMRMDRSQSLSAYDVVNSYDQETLGEILREYGEVRYWREITKKICETRKKEPIKDTKTLLKIIGDKKERGRKVSVATLVFQALRIEVNNELGELAALLTTLEKSNINECIVGIISFHSLEDRIVKKTFKEWSKNCICLPDVMRCECGNNHSKGKILTKKPITPSKEEVKTNPRARSSKLRAFYIQRRSFER